MKQSPPVIVGCGIAGLTVALTLAPRPAIILARKVPGLETSSNLAQGGIAAAMGADDSPELHAQDTMAAGAFHGDPAIIHLVTRAGPQAIRQLAAWGVAFDRDGQGRLDLTLEGAHCRRRVVHAGGDGTGAAVVRTLMDRARSTPSITIVEDANVVGLAAGDNGITGVAFTHHGKARTIATDNVVLATGGSGALWQYTTNPLGSWGHGLVLASRAGAALRDLEFVQFHPTAIDSGQDPLPLASESLRGEGAILINDLGERFMACEPMGDLSPRDVVSRAIWAQLQDGRRVFLDVHRIASFATRFPTIYDLCRTAGIDPVRQPIPVRPAAHYHMGGIAVDMQGRTNVDGLWAGGEAAATGLHGANRLASNSLLEAVVFGRRIAQGILGAAARAPATAVAFPEAPPIAKPEERDRIRSLMMRHVGVQRDKAGLETAVEALSPLAVRCDMALAALLIARAALAREESLGAHCRTDFPEIHCEPKYAFGPSA